ncbi:MAG: hypothetical protein JXP34_22820 [Planctomycetes bacterium]|nr:hypothetical protein [Planctomycetota bacterium]
MIDDLYREWFDIRDSARPPDHYLLLGLPHFENHADLIRAAAIERACCAWSKRKGRAGRRAVRELLREVAAAHWVLSRRNEKALYDHGLHSLAEAEVEELAPEERFRRAAMLECLFAPPSARRKGGLIRQGEAMGVGPRRIRAVLEQIRDVRPRFDPQMAEDELREAADLPERRRALKWVAPAAVAAVSFIVIAILIERLVSSGRVGPGEAGRPVVAVAPEGGGKPEGAPAAKVPEPGTKETSPQEPPAAGPDRVSPAGKGPAGKPEEKAAAKAGEQTSDPEPEPGASPPGGEEGSPAAPPQGADPDAREDAILAERAAVALEELRGEVARLRGENRIDDILPALDRFPLDFRTDEAVAEIERIRGETEALLEAEFDEILARGRALADEGKFPEAIACFERARHWGIRDLAARAEVEIAGVLEKKRLKESAAAAPPTPEEVLDRAFGEALARIEATPARGDDVVLAGEMLERAASEGDPAVVEVIVERAAGLADATPAGIEVSIRAEELRARKLGRDPVDALAEIVRLREHLSTSALLAREDREARTEDLLDDLAELARLRIEQGRFADASDAFSSSSRAAKRVHDDRWVRYADGYERKLRPWIKVEKDLALARRAIESRPTDQGANRRIGRHLLLIAGDDAAAEPYLTAGRDRRLLSLIEASRQLGNPPERVNLLQFAKSCMDAQDAVTVDLQRLALIGEAEEAWRAVLASLSPVDDLRYEIANAIARADRDAEEIAEIDPALPEPWLALWTAADSAPHLAELVLREQRHDGAIWRRAPEDLYFTRQYARRKIVIASHPPRRDAPMRFLCRRGLTERTSLLYIGVRARDPDGSVELRVLVDDHEIERRTVGGQWIDLRVDLGEWKGGTHAVVVACYPDDWRDETVLWDYVSFAPPGP